MSPLPNHVWCQESVGSNALAVVELQREGWIRSIGVQSTESEKLRQGITTYFGDYIDFEEREGHLLLPPDLFSPQTKPNIKKSQLPGEIPYF